MIYGKGSYNEMSAHIRFILLRLTGAGLAFTASTILTAATLGRVIPIGGQAADIALDEARRVLYVANYTANRIDVVSLGDYSIKTSMNVAAEPSSLSISPDGRFLVVAHFAPFAAPATPNNALTIIDLITNSRQTFTPPGAPLGVQFGIDGKALLVTNVGFLLLDPATGATETLQAIGLSAKTLPAGVGDTPSSIVASSMGASGDLSVLYGVVAGGSDSNTLHFRYNVNSKSLLLSSWINDPPLGPRSLSVSRDGANYIVGWSYYASNLNVIASFPNPSGILNIGTHAIDSRRGLIYSQFSAAAAAATATLPGASAGSGAQSPILYVQDADNLTILEKLQLPENLSGKSLLASDGSLMFSVSESGITVIPIGSLNSIPRILTNVEDIVFKSSFCDRKSGTQQITVSDPGGNRVPFTIASGSSGVTLSPTSGVTPMTITVRVDQEAFRSKRGTSTVMLKVTSTEAVNVPKDVRVLVNTKEPDQKGTSVNVAGTLVDILADPTRDRFFILRQDMNQVLVFDATSYNQVATLKTSTNPLQMAITFDRRYLLIANDSSRLIRVYDLETLQEALPVFMPGGHAPRSIACSSSTCLIAVRNDLGSPAALIDRLDVPSRQVITPKTLGIYKNEIGLATNLIASANGSSILMAQSDGTLMLYNSSADSFTISRKLTTSVAGAIAASNFDQYVVGNLLLNASLVPIRTMSQTAGLSSGFAFIDQSALRVGAPDAASPGVIERVTLPTGDSVRATRIIEAPLLPAASGAASPATAAFTQLPFFRTLAPLYSRNAIIVLTTGGFSVLPWSYDSATSSPRLTQITNAADQNATLAPGSLVSIKGTDLSPINLATNQMPLPTALGESCLTVNGLPLPVLFVSSTQINAQLPYQVDGNVTLVLHTPGGVSDNFNITILPAAPSIFRNGTAGTDSGIPAIIRASNSELVTLSNPVHKDDSLTIYLSGMGNTSPAVEAGVPAPSDPLPSVLIPPVVTLGGVPVSVTFAGLTPGQIGVYQINVTINRKVPSGIAIPLVVSQAGSSTSANVRIVD